jgi:histidinol-phosphate phosphatase family protein
MNQAIILAGGKGTRLQERLNGLPKPLVDICGEPLLGRQLSLLSRYGYTNVLILVNHGSKFILEFCSSQNYGNMHIECIDDGEPLGTAGSVIAAFKSLAPQFLVMYGDTLLDVDLSRFENFHNQSIAVGSLFLHPNDHPVDSDLVEVDDRNIITAFKPYPHPDDRYHANLVNAGLYYLEKTLLSPWLENRKLLDFGRDIFPAALNQGAILNGYISPEYIKDCGTPKRLDKVCADFSSGRVSRLNLALPQVAVFLDRDGTLNKLNGYISKPEQMELLPGVAKALNKLNRSDYLSIVATNQPAVARGECTQSELKLIHNKFETLLGQEGAYVDRIEYCPHHPDSGFSGEILSLKIGCSCRKPGTGMISGVAKEWNIDLSRSWFIGDSSADFLAAFDAGVKSIGVETGAAGLDGRYAINPNFWSPHFDAAVDFILNDYKRITNKCRILSEKIGQSDWVFIGGFSRAGKSTFSQCYQDALKTHGLSSVIVSMDSWLLGDSDRKEGVDGRYDLDELRHWMANLQTRSQETDINIPFYDRKTKTVRPSERRVKIGADDVIIFEGTLALLIADSFPYINSHRYFIEIDEEVRKERVIKQYLLRGFSKKEAEITYLSRQKDEGPIILRNITPEVCRVRLNLSAGIG